MEFFSKQRSCLILVISVYAAIHLLDIPFCHAETVQPTNYITLIEEEGRTTQNYPVQIARPFLKGEIVDFPQAIVDETPLLTQADVKQRYADGSVKHAIVTFVVPEIHANSTVQVSFINQPSGLNDQRLTQEEMLAEKFDFEATMELNFGTTSGVASARQMLENGDLEYWMEGPVATSVILADHSVERAYDIGADKYRSFRPIFHATFWPAIQKVRVRFIGEVSNSEALQDQHYALKLYTGDHAKIQVYEQSTFNHLAKSRWTREFWIGGGPGNITIDHNIEYLIKTKFAPNFDVNKKAEIVTLQEIAANWEKSDKSLFGEGLWYEKNWYDEASLLTKYTSLWLLNQEDAELMDVALGEADLAAAWGNHVREGDPSKFLDRARTVPGVGHVLSISTRPGIRNADLPLVGERTSWTIGMDIEHLYEPFSMQYVLTGDFWYLEELYFWAGYEALFGKGGEQFYNGRGPTGAEGHIYFDGTMRAQAWRFRLRLHAASFAPDEHPENTYFNTLMADAIAIWDGYLLNENSAYYNNENWLWGRDVYHASIFNNRGLSPLFHWNLGQSDPASGKDTIPGASQITSPWQYAYFLVTLGRAEELGYPVHGIKNFIAQHVIGIVTKTNYPHLVGSYKEPIVKDDGEYVQNWQEWTSFFPSDDLSSEAIQEFEECPYAYQYSMKAMAGISFITDIPGGAETWEYISSKRLHCSSLNGDPTWALIPRTEPVQGTEPVQTTYPLHVTIKGTGQGRIVITE